MTLTGDTEKILYVWIDGKTNKLHVTSYFSTPFFDESGRFVVLGEL